MLEDILKKYFGFNGTINGQNWNKCYEMLIALIVDLGKLGVGIDADKVIHLLDQIGNLTVEGGNNCHNETFDCDACSRNGECPSQGTDGKPFWLEECDCKCDSCVYADLCWGKTKTKN